jgi:hypothetical protein
MPDDHSESVPPLPIPNRTVKRLRADDSAATSVKVGHRQASYKQRPRSVKSGAFLLCGAAFGRRSYASCSLVFAVTRRQGRRFTAAALFAFRDPSCGGALAHAEACLYIAEYG